VPERRCHQIPCITVIQISKILRNYAHQKSKREGASPPHFDFFNCVRLSSASGAAPSADSRRTHVSRVEGTPGAAGRSVGDRDRKDGGIASSTRGERGNVVVIQRQ